MVMITESQFVHMAKSKLGESWQRALAVFRHYGFDLAFDVMLVLLYAVNHSKLDEVLTFLEEHYENYLRFHQPELRDPIRNGLSMPSLTQHVLNQMLEQGRELDRLEKLKANA